MQRYPAKRENRTICKCKFFPRLIAACSPTSASSHTDTSRRIGNRMETTILPCRRCAHLVDYLSLGKISGLRKWSAFDTEPLASSRCKGDVRAAPMQMGLAQNVRSLLGSGAPSVYQSSTPPHPSVLLSWHCIAPATCLASISAISKNGCSKATGYQKDKKNIGPPHTCTHTHTHTRTSASFHSAWSLDKLHVKMYMHVFGGTVGRVFAHSHIL